MSLFELYLIQIKDMMGMLKIWSESNYIDGRYYFIWYFYVTVTPRSSTIITDYVGIIYVLSPNVDL
jgi:hypothetical protein